MARRATSATEVEMGCVIDDKDASLRKRGAKMLEAVKEVSESMVPLRKQETTV